MPERPRECVLLVEDTAPSRYVVQRMLKGAGFDVLEAASGKEALVSAQQQPDLIVLDINLPDIDGYEVCRRLKTSKVTASIPVLHLSASYVKPEDLAHGLDSGADGYLTHPVDELVLIATIKAILRARRAEEASHRAEAEARRLFALAEQRLLDLEKARQAADTANRAKDQFLAVLSHELRTPLSPVYMTIVSLEQDPQLAASVREQLSMMRRNVELETRLIDDLLDVSRIANNKLRLELAVVSVHDVLHHVATVCASEVNSKHLEMSWELNAEHDEVMADSPRLHQALWNLAKNAVKFTPENGRIAVRTSLPSEDIIRIEVRDNGVGIMPEALPRIFQTFDQGDPNTNRRFGGLGLGLAISQAIIRLHGGEITASSEGKDRGATFTVDLPTSTISARNKAGDSRAPSDEPHPVLRLLVVDDHADTVTALARLLRSAGYAVKTASSASAALSLTDHEPFDLVISDLGLPGMNGYDLMRQIRKQSPVLLGIAMSGFGMEEDIRRSHDAGFTEHLVKPVSMNQLEIAIRKLFPMPAPMR